MSSLDVTLSPLARVLHRALLSLRGRRVCVQVESYRVLAHWARARGVEHFETLLGELAEQGLVIVDRQYGEVQVLTEAQAYGSLVMIEAERDWRTA